VSVDPKDRWQDLGSFIREQRNTARLSLRRLSELAGISNPYLSQIERGLRRPSAEILQQIAKALRISAETLYVQAGILEPPDGTPDLTRLILADQSLSEDQKQALVRIYLSFRRDFEEERANEAGHDHGHAHLHGPIAAGFSGVGGDAAGSDAAGGGEAAIGEAAVGAGSSSLRADDGVVEDGAVTRAVATTVDAPHPSPSLRSLP
jgi:transcriptional regulator with XRE-family HTH domain